MPPVTITAQGTSTIFHQAERAVIFVQVISDGTSQDQVSKDVASTASDLRATLQTLAPKTEQGTATPDAAVTYWKNSTLSTNSFEPQDKNGKKLPRQYSARTTFEVKVRDFERLGPLVTSLATMPHVTIRNIQWRLTEETKASLGSQSRKDAVTDAVMKARDYADVLGRGKPEAFEVADGAGPHTSTYQPMAQQQVGVGLHGGANLALHQQGGMLNFQPESLQLVSTVTVKFLAD